MFGGRLDLAPACRAQTEHRLHTARLRGDDVAWLDLEIAAARERHAERMTTGDDVVDAHQAAGVCVDDARRADHALGEAVLAEAADLFEDALAKLARDAFLLHRRDQALAVLLDAA